MSSTKTRVICYSILTLLFITSLALRIAVPWDHVFAGQWVKFTDNDAYFYVRLLDNLAQHFPWLGDIDPYRIFPGNIDLSHPPLFFVYFMGFFAWLLGAGAPSPHLVDLVAVYFPAVIGALLVFPVFYIGKTVFNRWAGLMGAALITILPGEFLARTLLGNTDSHVIEIFFTTMFMLFILLATNHGQGIRFFPLKQIDKHKLATPLIYSLLAGLCLGIYLASWLGALLFVFISFVWLVLQFILDHLQGKPTDYLGLIGFLIYAIALLITLPAPLTLMTRVSLVIALTASTVLYLLSNFMQRRHLNASYFFPSLVCGLGIAAAVLLLIINPTLLHTMFENLTWFFTWRTGGQIAEMQPLLINQGRFTLALIWGNYTTASLLALAGLGFVIYYAVRKTTPEMLLIIVWSLLILMSALAKRRFAYYLTINVAILAGYAGWLILKLFGVNEKATENVAPAVRKVGGKSKHPSTGKKKLQPSHNPATLALGIILVAILIIYPNTGPLPGGDKPFFDVASKALFAPPDGWCEALDWVRDNTPEPYGDAGYYYAIYPPLKTNSHYSYPPSAYSIICWWDYGYWITRMGHRIPFSNPGSAQRGEQFYFTATDQCAAAKLSGNWGAKYVIVDDYMVNWNTGFRAIVSAAGAPPNKYFEIYYRAQQGKLVPTLLYYPDFYETLVIRLYCFDARSYTPAETAAISWEPGTASDGSSYKEITGLKTFRSYGDAQDFIASQKEGNWRLVGKDPSISPVPLEAMDNYKLSYASSSKAKVGNAEIPAVKVFEYNRDAIQVCGDWNGDKKTEGGIWEPDTSNFLLKASQEGEWNAARGDTGLGPFGDSRCTPVSGDWTSSGKSHIGVGNPRDRCFYLDIKGDGKWGEDILKPGPFGEGL